MDIKEERRHVDGERVGCDGGAGGGDAGAAAGVAAGAVTGAAAGAGGSLAGAVTGADKPAAGPIDLAAVRQAESVGRDQPLEPSGRAGGKAGAGGKKRRRTARRRRQIRRRVALAVLLALVAIGVGAFAYARHVVDRGRAAFDASAANALQSSVSTIEYQGKTYALNQNMVSVAFIGMDNYGEDDPSAGTGSGQADTVMVAALNTDTGKVTGILIPRDSMVPVDTYVDGSFAGQSVMQLCLQYSYGSSDAQGSQLVAACASRVLQGIPIDYYYMLNMTGIVPLNDAIGGVTLTAVQDVPTAGIKQGERVTLKGEAAEQYIRQRDHSDPESSLKRGQRQVSYFRAFLEQVLSGARSDPGMVLSLYRAAQGYTATNLGLSEFSYLASTVAQTGMSAFDIVTLQGQMGEGGDYAEFYLDEENVRQVVVDTYYHEVG